VYRLLLIIAAATVCIAEIPPSVMAERDLEKRSELALKVADESITAASKAYAAASELTAFQARLNEVEELTRLSLKSLQETGKPASKKPKYFKRAELKLRSLIRRMNTLSDEVSAEDRPRVQAATKVMSEAHEQLLHDIMSKR
jgi:hypothetical protein